MCAMDNSTDRNGLRIASIFIILVSRFKVIARAPTDRLGHFSVRYTAAYRAQALVSRAQICV